MRDNDVIIIGAGLFGSVIAHALHKQGRRVCVVDDRRPHSGTAPSGGLMKPSWFAGLGASVHEPALRLLDRLFGLREEEFDVYSPKVAGRSIRVKRQKVFRILPANITHLPPRTDFRAKAVHVGPGWVRLEGGVRLRAPLIVVAAGVWTKQLLECPVQPLQGMSFYFKGKLERGIIRPWAPYKQIVLHDDEPGVVWGGDGSAIKPENWTNTRSKQCLDRVSGALPRPMALLESRTGLRPYTKGIKPCLLEERYKGVWIATGGAKNGMIGAGWCAHRLLEVTS